MDILKATADQLAKYLTFLFAFVRTPRAAMVPFAVPSNKPPAINGDLLAYCALGVGASLLVTLTGSSLGMAPDASTLIRVLGGVDSKVMPLVTTLAIIAGAGLWHGLTRTLGTVLGRAIPELRFNGTLHGSINAALAFASLAIPAITAFVVALRVAVAHSTVDWRVFLVLGMTLQLTLTVYFVVAFAAVHQVAPGRYLYIMAATITLSTVIATTVA